jgi:hypothetical protein
LSRPERGTVPIVHTVAVTQNDKLDTSIATIWAI